MLTYVEALWDHVTMDKSELPFRVGDMILAKTMSDPDWWWGEVNNSKGWFPASFVRVATNQIYRRPKDNKIPPVARIFPSTTASDQKRKSTLAKRLSRRFRGLSMTKATKAKILRGNVVKEIISAERVYLKQLKDVVEGYLTRCQKRSDMFSEECVETVFSNIEEIYRFERDFCAQLEATINEDSPHSSDVASVFLNNKKRFEVYSEYCSNHSAAVTKLTELMSSKQYRYFFEACRLLQRMIDISVDGYLLTPVQKICKYPLQLSELLKYTDANDPNHQTVKEALKTMRNVATMVNEHKRQLENVENIAVWQKSILGWQGEDILERSTERIHSGDFYIAPYPKSRPQLRTAFLFDHQLIFCKKDYLRKDLYYKTRFNLDECEIIDPSNSELTEHENGQMWKHWWKIQPLSSPIQFICVCKDEKTKQKWMKAFETERTISMDVERPRVLLSDTVKKQIVVKASQTLKRSHSLKRSQTLKLTKSEKRPWEFKSTI